jgi:hypothetical protein
VLQNHLFLARELVASVRRLSAAALKYRGSVRVLALARRWDRLPLQFRLHHGAMREPRPAKVVRVPPKKYSPPYPLDTKGCCSPQNNPKKSSWYSALGFRPFQMICLSIVPIGLAACCENAPFSPNCCNLLVQWTFAQSISWRFEYISSLGLLSGLPSLTGNR